MSELSLVVGHPADVTKNCSMEGKNTSYIYECGSSVRVKEIYTSVFFLYR